MDVNELLYDEGVKYGMCDKFRNIWNDPSIEELCDMYFKGMDFCVQHDYPSLEILDKHLKGKTEKYGVFINEEANNVSGFKRVAIVGDSKINVRSTVLTDITVRHNSIVTLNAEPQSFTYISIYDNAKLIIESKGEGAKICVSQWGGEIINKDKIDKLHIK